MVGTIGPRRLVTVQAPIVARCGSLNIWNGNDAVPRGKGSCPYEGVIRVLVVLVVGVVAGGVVFMVFGSQLGSLFGTATKSSSSQVIKAVDREEQIVLVSLGIQGLEREEATQQVLGKTSSEGAGSSTSSILSRQSWVSRARTFKSPSRVRIPT